jgi:hypothetical protein
VSRSRSGGVLPFFLRNQLEPGTHPIGPEVSRSGELVAKVFRRQSTGLLGSTIFPMVPACSSTRP